MRNFRVTYFAKFTGRLKYCGIFPTLTLANDHVTYLQRKLKNGEKILFNITELSGRCRSAQ